MRYVIFVSHGTFAPGLYNALGMIAGTGRDDLLCTSLLDGMDVATYGKNLTELIAPITAEDEVILMGDLAGGSPLTKAAEMLAQKGVLKNTAVIGGMNLSMALTAALADEDDALEDVVAEVMETGKEQVKRVVFQTEDDTADDDI